MLFVNALLQVGEIYFSVIMLTLAIVMFTYGETGNILSQKGIGINIIQGDIAVSDPEYWV